MSSHGGFNYRKNENVGIWNIKNAPSLTDSSGVATLEGRLKLKGNQEIDGKVGAG